MTPEAEIALNAMLASQERLADDMREMRMRMEAEFGQLRQINDRLTKIEAKQDDLVEVKKQQAVTDAKVARLEAEEARRNGERGMLGMITKSPLTYVLAAFGGLVAWLKGGF